MKQVCFVILHYKDAETTAKCIDSILRNIEYLEYAIVVVDNASGNGSAQKLEEKYGQSANLFFLSAKENLGFAKGNNLGYRYAKETLKAEYIIIANNDTLFTQRKFVHYCIRECEEHGCALIGPDVVTPQGVHQNPHRDHIMTRREVKKMLFIKSVFLWYFKMKRALHIGERIMILEKMFEEKDKVSREKIVFQEPAEEVVLVGACLVFTPLYVQQEDEAFCPDTFMYGEEDLLSYKCRTKKYKIRYAPRLQVTHTGGESTKAEYQTRLEKDIFTYTYIVKGCKILLRAMRKNEV